MVVLVVLVQRCSGVVVDGVGVSVGDGTGALVLVLFSTGVDGGVGG